MNTKRTAILIALAMIFLDQALKIWVKTHLMEGQEIIFANWARLHFVENPGMAFSLELPGQYGKLLLSWFRVFAISGIGYLLWGLLKEKNHPGLIYSGALIFAGAVGNLIDSVFYGVVFSDSFARVAEVFPPQGYAPLMQGHVVDMLWFPMIHGVFPTWLPIWGGDFFEFFSPVFNIADSAITVGVFLIIFFQKKFFSVSEKEVAFKEESPENEILETEISSTPAA